MKTILDVSVLPCKILMDVPEGGGGGAGWLDDGAGWSGGGAGSPSRTELAVTRGLNVLCRAEDMSMDTSLVPLQYIYCRLHESSLLNREEIMTNRHGVMFA